MNPRREWDHWLVLGCTIALACALRLYRISDPVDGYHAFNEGWYAIIARNYAQGSFLYPQTFGAGVDFRSAPLYSYLLYAAQLAIGDYVVAGRIVSTLSSAVAMGFTYLLGRKAFGPLAGSFAALVFGFAPVAVAVGRNAQTDMTYLAFLLGALYFYLQSRSSSGTRDAILTGAFFAAAFFTKYFAALLPIAILLWELLYERGRRLDRKLGVSFAVFAVLISPYYLHHLTTSYDAFLAQQIGGAVKSTQLAFSWSRLGAVLEEEFFGFSPLLAIVIAASTVYAILRRDRLSVLFLVCFGAYFALFYFNHRHSYYMLTQLPFLALLAGRLLSRIRSARLAAAVGAVLLLSGSFSSLLFLTSVKYGWDVPRKMIARMTEHSNDPLILLERSLMISTGPALKYYCPACDLVVKERLDAEGVARVGASFAADSIEFAGRRLQRSAIKVTPVPDSAEG